MPFRAPEHDVLRELQWLHGFAQRLASSADVDDLVQDTWVAAWRAAPQLTGERPLRPWLARVLRNRLRNLARGRARRLEREQLADVSASSADIDSDLQRVALLEVLATLVSELPEQDQRIIVRRYMDEQTAAEIAHALGMPAATVRSRLKRALAHLRHELDERYGGRSAWVAIAGTWPGVPGMQPASVPLALSGTIKSAIVVATIAASGAAVWAGSPGVDADDEDRAAMSTRAVGDAEHEGDPIRSVSPEREAWERTKHSILAARPESDAPTSGAGLDAPDAEIGMAVAMLSSSQQEVFDDCAIDIGLRSGESFAIESDIVGAPGIGTIVSDVRLRGATEARDELLECVTEGTYALRGPAPQQFFESTMSFEWGSSTPEELPQPTPLDAAQTERVAKRQRALRGTLRSCQGDDDAIEGTAILRLSLGDGGRVSSIRMVEATLNLAAVDCMAEVMHEQWSFEDLPPGTVLQLEQTFPV